MLHYEEEEDVVAEYVERISVQPEQAEWQQ